MTGGNVNLELATDAENDCTDVFTCTRTQVRWVYGRPIENRRIVALSREKFRIVSKIAAQIENRQVNLTEKAKGGRFVPDLSNV